LGLIWPPRGLTKKGKGAGSVGAGSPLPKRNRVKWFSFDITFIKNEKERNKADCY
jgi:hypothetical protein